MFLAIMGHNDLQLTWIEVEITIIIIAKTLFFHKQKNNDRSKMVICH